jgi:hypothetical protein
MPWQERDWAKWTDEERNRFLGTSGNRGSGGTRRPPAGGSGLNRRLSRSQTLLALGAIAAIIGYAVHNVANGQSQGLVLPRTTAPKHRSMQLPSSLQRGTYLTSSDTLGTNVSGPVIVEGRWGRGPWYRLASANATNGAYRVRYLLDRPGLVHLRIALPDGNYLVGTVRIT